MFIYILDNILFIYSVKLSLAFFLDSKFYISYESIQFFYTDKIEPYILRVAELKDQQI